jgi:hypothetical protein
MFLFPLALLLAAAPVLTTVEEQSNGTRTGRYAEVETICAAYPKAFPGRVRCEKFGVTPEGRPMLALIAGDGPLEAKKAKAAKRPVVFLQGGIHAGEIDGKDAGFRLLKDLLVGKVEKDILKTVTVVFVPVFNIDGHERFGPNHRPNQRGPEEMGWRTTAQNLNLNRDAAKAEAPETVALLGLLNAWDPILLADLHVTDGAKFQHDVAVLLQPQKAGRQPLLALVDAAKAQVFEALTKKGHLPLDFYPAFEEDDRPESGFAVGVAPPRYETSYWFFRNRIGCLVETHSWRPYAHRVQTTYDVALELLRAATKDGTKWLEAAAKLDAESAQSGGTQQVLSWDNTKTVRTFDFQGFHFTREDSAVSGKKWIRYDESKPEVWKVPLMDELQPKLTVTAPKAGYVVAAQHAAWVAAKLNVHGIVFETVKTARPALAVESFRAGEVKFKPVPFEGRQQVEVKGAWSKDARDVAAGSLFVPVGQAKALLVLHLFEPLAPDSLVSWGYFNAHLSRTEYMEDYVAEEVARGMLADAKLKAEFEAKLKDPEFKKSPERRLDFFYARHPSYDERFNLVPVYRVDQKP